MKTAPPIDDHQERKKKLSSLLLSKKKRIDRAFFGLFFGAAGYTLLLVALVVYAVGEGSIEIFSYEGFLDFLTGTNWNPVYGRDAFGALPYLIGTLVTAGIAMVIGVPVSMGIAVFLAEIAPPRVSTPLSFVIELLAAVPSIVYGLWALFVFRFWIVDYIERPMYNAFGDWIPLFGKTPFGLDVFTAGIVLAIMIIPIISSISRELLKAVPDTQREAAYSLGATRWETLRVAVFPYVKSGLFGASFLGLGRAVGETILVTMVIGNAVGINAIPTSLFSQSQTLASVIANEFNEAASSLHLSALIGLGAVLLMLTMAINIGGQLLVSRMVKVSPGVRE
jgi:phosphate transport system permease protein